jgi:class 3 adenylate cyclase
VAPGDTEALRRQKAILTLGVLLKSVACPVWIIGYGSMGYRVAATAPLAYMVLSAVSTARFMADKRFSSYNTRQIILMLVLPAAMQFALGGYVPGSAVILWALLAPLMAFLFHGARGASAWMVAFVLLLAGSAVLEAMEIPPPAPTPGPFREFFFAMNVIFVAIIVCATVRYFAVRLEAEQVRSEALLFHVLPASIAERLKTGEEPIADLCPEVSVLFADLVGFTRLSMHVPPTEMVEMLNRVFSRFDALALRHGMEKIRTIGDGYLVVAGLPAGRPEQAVASAMAAAEMALDLQEAVRRLALESGWPLSLRIGIASGGPIIAGVIGTQKYVYDVWGDVVNTASRMESHGVPGTIQITEATYQRLQGLYTFEDRGLLEVKGKGSMYTYLLTGRVAINASVPDLV